MAADSQPAQLKVRWCLMHGSDLAAVSHLGLKEKSQHSSFVMQAEIDFNLSEL